MNERRRPAREQADDAKSKSVSAATIKELNLNRLGYFHVVARAGSLQDGARQLGLAPSTVSEQIRLLESSLGAKLFERVSSGLRLTRAGERVAAQTDAMFAAVGRIGTDLRPSLTPDMPKLDVGVTSSISQAFTSALFLPLFEQENVVVRLRHADSDTLVHRLRSLETDLVIADSVRNGNQTRGMQKRRVRRIQLVVMAEHSIAAALGRFPEDALEHPFVHHSVNTNLRWPVDHFLRMAGLAPRVIAEVDDVTLMMEITRRSKGWCIVPDVPTALQGDGGGSLVPIKRLDEEHDVEIHAFYMDSPVTELITRAVDVLAGGPTRGGAET